MSTIRAAARATGVPYSTLCRWLQEGVLQAPPGHGRSQGRRMPWTPELQRQACLARVLRAAGLTLSETRQALRYRAKPGKGHHLPPFLVLAGKAGTQRLQGCFDSAFQAAEAAIRAGANVSIVRWTENAKQGTAVS